MSIRLSLLPALAAGLLATAPVLAQPSETMTHRDVVAEHRIAELHSKLKITPGEEGSFADFAAAMRDNAQRMDGAVIAKRANAATATAVDQMKAYAELAQTHAEEVNRLIGPFSKLYDALTPEQRKLADQSFRDFSTGRMGRAARG